MFNMKRLESIVNFAKDVNGIYAKALETEITKEEVYYLRKIDPEFDDVCDKFNKLIGGSTQTTTQTKISASTTTIPSTTNVASMPTAPSTTTSSSSTEIWKNHPDLKGVEISNLGNVHVNGKSVNSHMYNGYMSFRTNDRKTHPLASAVLTTFKCHRLGNCVPVYKDGNRENCKLSNLEWGIKYTSRDISDAAIERACKLIAENYRLSKHAMVNLLVKENCIKRTTFASILSGKWKRISDKYFVVVNGYYIIPNNSFTKIKERIVSYIDEHSLSTTTNTTSDCCDEIWKHHPNFDGVEISNLGNVRIYGENVDSRMNSGYKKFSHGMSEYSLARHVLITFCGNRNRSFIPVYKDRNRENCKLSNLEWGRMKYNIDAENIEQICKFIAENPHMNHRAMFNILAKRDLIGWPTTIESIVSGEYKTISDKYFVVVDGCIIPTANGSTN